LQSAIFAIKTSNFGFFFSHLRLSHGIHFDGVDVCCGQQDCARICSSFRALKRHFQKYYFDLLADFNVTRVDVRDCLAASITDGHDNVSELDNRYVGAPSDNIVHEMDLSVSLDHLPSAIMQFVIKLQAQPYVLISNVQKTITEFQFILGDVSNFSTNTLKKCV